MINPKKFYERTKLFKDIIYEIFKVESNYRTDLSLLNLKLLKKIEEHKNNLKKPLKKYNTRQSLPIEIKNFFRPSRISSSSSRKSEDFILLEKEKEKEKEENQFINKLISEGLQQFLNYYKSKHNLISKEVSSLGIILYNFTSQSIERNNSDIDFNLENNEKDFDIYYNKLTVAKQKYFNKMNELELFFHNENNVKDNNNNNNKKIKQNNNNINNINNKNNLNKIENEEEIEKEKIKELNKFRLNYKKSLDEINNMKRIYISKINEICNQVQEFNLVENSLFINFFRTFNENLIELKKEVDKYCSLYEYNHKVIENLNIEFSKQLMFDNKINMNYEFEEYNPKFSDIHNKKDLSVIQKMHKLIGFEFNNISKNEIDDLQNKEKDNVLFIILMDKFISTEDKLNEKEKYLLKSLFNQEKYITEFLIKLNVIRINKKLFYSKEKFDILFNFFEVILSKISFNDEKNHDIVKQLMILTETFYYKNENKKVFLNNVLKLPNEVKDMKFWIRYIEIEIEKEITKMSNNNKSKNKNNNTKFEYIVLLSNITHLREYIGEKEKLKIIVDYFKDKYNFSIDDTNIIRSQLNL